MVPLYVVEVQLLKNTPLVFPAKCSLLLNNTFLGEQLIALKAHKLFRCVTDRYEIVHEFHDVHAACFALASRVAPIPDDNSMTR